MRLLAGRSSLWCLSVGLCMTAPALASVPDLGTKGPALAGSGPRIGLPSVTSAKPESKIWAHDGHWFASLWNAANLEFRIHRLDTVAHAWVDTGVAVDARPDSHSDALVVGDALYLATHEFAEGPGNNGHPELLLRYGYDTFADRYTLDPGFPAIIANRSTEVLVIDRDSTGTLWAAWKQDGRVYLGHTLGSDTSWSAPAALPVQTSDFTSDDVCSLIHFGDRIGVLWSDQALLAYSFSTHLDGADATSWSAVETALFGESDDHLDLAADVGGRVFATVKNHANEIKLLVRDGGTWTQYLVATAAENLNRAIVQLNEQAGTLHVFASSGGAIVEKVSPLGAIGFGPATPILKDGSGLPVQNATTSKQNVDASTGRVVLAANVTVAGNYWYQAIEPEPNGLVLEPLTPGVAGVVNTFTARDVKPQGILGFFVSMDVGAGVIPLLRCPGGIPIQLGQPFYRVGIVRANADGVAKVSLMAPPGIAGLTFYFQAVEPFACRSSNVVEEDM